MVSIAATSRKYRGRKAATYDAVRTKQLRWKQENEIVERMLRGIAPRTVLDVPVGTGRYLQLYKQLGCEHVEGLDISEAMLVLARRKLRALRWRSNVLLRTGDATYLGGSVIYDAAVCVRFLDLIDEAAMRKVVKELCRVATSVVCTIRFGEKYVPKSNTAEHDEKKFRALVRGQGFEIVEQVPIFNAGWHVVHMRRRNK